MSQSSDDVSQPITGRSIQSIHLILKSANLIFSMGFHVENLWVQMNLDDFVGTSFGLKTK